MSDAIRSTTESPDGQVVRSVRVHHPFDKRLQVRTSLYGRGRVVLVGWSDESIVDVADKETGLGLDGSGDVGTLTGGC